MYNPDEIKITEINEEVPGTTAVHLAGAPSRIKEFLYLKAAYHGWYYIKLDARTIEVFQLDRCSNKNCNAFIRLNTQSVKTDLTGYELQLANLQAYTGKIPFAGVMVEATGDCLCNFHFSALLKEVKKELGRTV